MPSPITLCGSLSKWAVSLGATMHEAGYRAAGLDWRYVPFETEDLAGALRGMRALSIRGFGVSMPFKLDIMPLLDRIDPVAQRIGAVNTVVNDGHSLEGHNTDAVGAVRALGEALDLSGKRVLLLGAGGAARAVAVGLSQHDVSLSICNRSGDRAQQLAQALGASPLPWHARNELGDFDVVVNASSLGMRDVDPASPLDASALRGDLVLMDIVYKPLATRLLSDARARGAHAIHGGRMLLHQAARQFELYTGIDAPLAAMDEAMQREIGQL
jgi:shikimate dehydrogenase